MNMKKGISLLLAGILTSFVALSGCSSNTSSPADGIVSGSSAVSTAASTGNGEEAVVTSTGTLVLGESQFNGVFSPFFATSAFDSDVFNGLICEPLIGNDRNAQPVDGVCKYQVPETIDENGDGIVEKTVYTFTLRDEVTFSDGTKPTSDDIIFSLKVYFDPTYDGKNTLNSLPIPGLNEYRYDDPDYAVKLAEISDKVAAFKTEDATDEIIQAAAQTLSDAYGVELAEVLPGGQYYEDETVPILPEAYRESLTKAYIQESLAQGGNRVPDIAGVERVDDKTVKITLEGVNPSALWTLGLMQLVSASHYGGDSFQKGDLSAVKAQNGVPMGSGPYKFVSYENNVVSLEAQADYWNGTPKNAKIKFQVVDYSSKLQNVQLGNCDISDPNANQENVKAAEDAGLEYRLIDNLGYGYVGINAERIPDKNVRKGLMSLLDRQTSVNAYYGDLAEVLERPMSKISWAYPQNAKAYYNYSREDAKKYFEAAGYQTDADGKLVKDGKQLSVEIWADGLSDHPAKPMLTQMMADMEALGAQLVIQDVSTDVLFDHMNSSTADMWCAAWQATIDPDIYQLYNSESNDNPYRIKNAELDELVIQARSTLDIEKRKELYAKCLDLIMDEAIEMPFYQRKNMYVFNPSNIDMTSLPEDMTPYYNWRNEVQNIVMTTR